MTFARFAPTVAAPSARSLLAGLRGLVAPAGQPGALHEALGSLFPGFRVVTFDSGRAALAEALRVAMRATGRSRVVLPAYTSYSVAAAAVHAGAAVDLCDLDATCWDLDRTALRGLVGPDTAAVVLGNLFGYPDRTADLRWLAGTGTMLIDDAAQALGAREDGRAAGSRGDLGVLSFGRGKCVTLGDGGALLVRDPSLAALASAPPPRSRGLKPLLMAAAMRLCVHPASFGVVSRMPGLGIGESRFEPGFRAAGAPSSVVAMAADLPSAVQRQLDIRRRVASWWEDVLAAAPAATRPCAAPLAEPAFLRAPFLADSPESRRRIAVSLAQVGFRYVHSFPWPLGRVLGRADDAQSAPVAARMAACMLALPCHEGLTRRAVERAARVILGRDVP